MVLRVDADGRYWESFRNICRAQGIEEGGEGLVGKAGIGEDRRNNHWQVLADVRILVTVRWVDGEYTDGILPFA